MSEKIRGFRTDVLAFQAARKLGLVGERPKGLASKALLIDDLEGGGWIYRTAHCPEGGEPLGVFVVDTKDGPVALDPRDDRLDPYDVF